MKRARASGRARPRGAKAWRSRKKPVSANASARSALEATVGAAAEASATAEESAAPVVDFYRREMRPFLESRGARHPLLSSPDRSRSTFEGLRMLLPLGLQDPAKKLEQICEEERQLRRQSLLHHWLHGWLMLHIPLSFALLLLGVVHAITALRY